MCPQYETMEAKGGLICDFSHIETIFMRNKVMKLCSIQSESFRCAMCVVMNREFCLKFKKNMYEWTLIHELFYRVDTSG